MVALVSERLAGHIPSVCPKLSNICLKITFSQRPSCRTIQGNAQSDKVCDEQPQPVKANCKEGRSDDSKPDSSWSAASA